MTLNLLVAAPDQIHMCCDFRLTDRDTGQPVDHKTQKLTSFSASGWSALVAVSGVGVLDGQNVGQWVASKLGELSFGSSLDDLLALLKTAETSLASVRVGFRHHTFTVGAIVHGRAVVALVSNFQGLSERSSPKVPESTLTISMQRPARVRVYTAGSGAAAVRDEDRVELEGLVRAGAPQQDIQEKLKAVNERAAGPLVSRGCYVASRFADGSGTARPYLTDEQKGDFILPETSQMFQRMGIQLNPKLDEHGNPEPIRMVQAAYASMEMTAGYFKRELPKRPQDAELQNNYGAFLNNGGHTAQAEAAFRRAIELRPAFLLARRNLAGLLANRDATRAEALQIYESLLDEDGIETDVRSDFAVCLETAGDLDRAEQEHAAASRAGDSPRAIARHATFVWQRLGRADDAEELFSRIHANSVRDADTLTMMARFRWLAKQDSDSAEDLFGRALSLAPKNIDGLCGYGDFLFIYRGDPATALAYYRHANKAMQKKNAALESNEGLAFLGVGGRPDRAIARFRRAIKLEPGLYAARVNLALALYLAGQRQAANDELATLHGYSNVPDDVAMEADTLAAVFGNGQDVRRQAKSAVDARLCGGDRLGQVFLAILKRHFHSQPELAVLRDWETLMSSTQA